MDHGLETTAPFRAESWGAAAEGGSPVEPSHDECEACGSRPLGEFSLCRECYSRLPENLCTAHVLDALER